MMLCVFTKDGLYQGTVKTVGGRFHAEQLSESAKVRLDWGNCLNVGTPLLRPMGFEEGLAMVSVFIALNDTDFIKAFTSHAELSGCEILAMDGEKIRVWENLLQITENDAEIYRYAKILSLWPETELDAFTKSLT